jgi:membrane-associated phospholipid phosphatase
MGAPPAHSEYSASRRRGRPPMRGAACGVSRVYLRAALGAAAVFAAVAAASAAGWLLPADAALLRGLVAARSCTAVALSSLASLIAAIETAAVGTALGVLVLLLAGRGPRALCLGAWVLSLPLELGFKLLLHHPHPVTAAAGLPLVCTGTSPLTNPYLSPFTDPTRTLLLNPEAQVLAPLGTAVGHTFPSGYVTRLTFFAVLGGLGLWAGLGPRWRGWAVGALALGALALAATRLVLAWHWPSDVVGGAALGATTACLARAAWTARPGARR